MMMSWLVSATDQMIIAATHPTTSGVNPTHAIARASADQSCAQPCLAQ